MKTNKIMLIDDHPVFRQGIKSMLGGSKFDVVAEIDSSIEVLSYLEKHSVDMIILDISISKLDGIAILETIKLLYPKIRVLVLTSYEDVITFGAALKLDVDGYLLKDASVNEILQALDDLANDKMVIDPMLMSKHLNNTKIGLHLTPTSLQILTLVANGERNVEIAKKMHLSERTIKGYLTNIYNKLGVKTRAEAVAKALQLQLIHL